MPKEVTIQEQTTAFVKKSIIIPLLLQGVGFINYTAKNKGRVQLITKILGDEPIGSMRSMPLRNDVVLEMDIRTESITLYERTQQDIYFPNIDPSTRKQVLFAPISTEEIDNTLKSIITLYRTYCYSKKDLLDLFNGSIFEQITTRLIENFLYVPNKPKVFVRKVSFVENGVLLEAGSGVVYFRVKISTSLQYTPVLYRYELAKMLYYQSLDSLQNYKDPSFLCGVYEYHNREHHILNSRKVQDVTNSFFTESALLTT